MVLNNEHQVFMNTSDVLKTGKHFTVMIDTQDRPGSFY